MSHAEHSQIEAKIVEHEPLARYTSWRIGGPARYFAAAANADELAALVRWGQARALPIFILGGGTNILVADGGYPGLVIRNRAMAWRVEEQGDDVRLWVESGAPTAGTARRMAAQGYGGLVWAEGLPGTIGGAIFGNAGCYGSDTQANLIRAWVLRDGVVEEWPKERFEHGYRTSVLKRTQGDLNAKAQRRKEREGSGDQGSGIGADDMGAKADSADHRPLTPDHPPVILAAELRLQRDDRQKLEAEMAAIAEARKGKTPAGSSCGSVFKNPPGTTAGTLLDRAGLKGTQVGGAMVSEKHANYIVNTGGATARDVLQLADIMRERVREAFGVEMQLEVQVVGEQL